MRARALPTPMIVAIAVAALLVLTLLPAPTLGAKGTEVDVSLESRLSQVSPGGIAAFEAELINGGSSTLTNLSFVFSLSGGTLVSPTNCAADGSGIKCPLDNVPGNTTTSLRLIVASGGPGSILVENARFSADARQGNPNATKSDIWPRPPEAPLAASAKVDSENGFYFGTWQQSGKPVPSPIVGTSSRQRTILNVPPIGFDYPLVVGQASVAGLTCARASEFGDEIDLQVADGQQLANGIIHVRIEYTHEAANRKNPNQVGVLHDCEPVAACSAQSAPCYTASWFGSGNSKGIRIDLYLLENGKIRGW